MTKNDTIRGNVFVLYSRISPYRNIVTNLAVAYNGGVGAHSKILAKHWVYVVVIAHSTTLRKAKSVAILRTPHDSTDRMVEAENVRQLDLMIQVATVHYSVEIVYLIGKNGCVMTIIFRVGYGVRHIV